MSRSIDTLITELYPPFDEHPKPRSELFSDGEYYIDEKHLEWWRSTILQPGATYQARQRYSHNLEWLHTARLFVPREYSPRTRLYRTTWDGEIEPISIPKIHLALLLFLIDNGGGINSCDLGKAKTEIQNIYIGLGKDPSKQLDSRDNSDYSVDRKNDWFSKLVNSFNRNHYEEEGQKHIATPSDYGIYINRRNDEREIVDIHLEHDFELELPYEVSREPDAITLYQEELITRVPDIVKESAQREQLNKQNEFDGSDPAITTFLLSLGQAKGDMRKRAPSPFEQWYKNHHTTRIIVRIETKEYYIVTEGIKRSIDLPAQQLALVLLFASHLSDGIALQDIVSDTTISREFNDWYHRIKRSSTKYITFDSLDPEHPNSKVLDLISKIKKVGIYISKYDNVYILSGISELIVLCE